MEKIVNLLSTLNEKKFGTKKQLEKNHAEKSLGGLPHAEK